jgi:hypothetical protein
VRFDEPACLELLDRPLDSTRRHATLIRDLNHRRLGNACRMVTMIEKDDVRHELAVIEI